VEETIWSHLGRVLEKPYEFCQVAGFFLLQQQSTAAAIHRIRSTLMSLLYRITTARTETHALGQ
jgi:hypothetical protein